MTHEPLPPRNNKYLIWLLPLGAITLIGGALTTWGTFGDDVEVKLLGLSVDITLVGIVIDVGALSLLGWLWRREDRKD